VVHCPEDGVSMRGYMLGIEIQELGASVETQGTECAWRRYIPGYRANPEPRRYLSLGHSFLQFCRRRGAQLTQGEPLPSAATTAPTAHLLLARARRKGP